MQMIAALKNWPKVAAARFDIGMVTLILAIMSMMVLPMPTLLIDVLIGTNLAIALVLLLVILHLNSPLSLSSFPAMLLVTTLFRLSLAIATTRLILLQGAPEIGQRAALIGLRAARLQEARPKVQQALPLDPSLILGRE